MHLRVILLALVAVVLGFSSCSKNAESTSGGMATQGTPPPPTEKYEGVDLDQLTGELRRWIVNAKQLPTNFEDFVAKAKVPVPPAPVGKKFSLSKDMRVIVVNR